jgi:serine/threonine-protein kinase
MNCARCGAALPDGAAACASCGGLAATMDDTQTGPLAAPHPPARFAPGEDFAGRYTIVEVIGEGGMGDVLKAIDRQTGHTIALKLIRARALERSHGLERFRRELLLAQKVTHPNVCRVHDMGEVSGLAYISMELVEGQTLEELIRSVGALSPRQTLALAQQICSGLEAIHAQSIVHRDLKPGNIMVDRAGHAIVMDFGMAYQAGGAKLTRDGAVLGTIAYLSPEQAHGAASDPRTDIWAVGLVLFEMLTGRRAPGDNAPVPLAVRENESCPPPSRLSPEVPPGLDAIVARCLEFDPARRFATAAELHAALAAADTASPSGPSAPRTMLRARPAARLVAAVALALGALVAAGPGREPLVQLLRLRAVPAQKQIAVLSFVSPESDLGSRAFSEGIVETLTSKLTQLERFQGSLWVVPASEVRQAEVASAAAARRLFGVTLVITGSVQRTGSLVRLTANLVDAATLRQLRSVSLEGRVEDVSLMQDGVVSRIVEMLELELSPEAKRVLAAGGTTAADAYELYAQGRGYLARYEQPESIESAIGLFQQALQRDPTYALAYAGLGQAYWRQYNLGKRPESAELAQKACRRAIELNDLLAPVHVTLGLVHNGTGRPDEAIAAFERALALDPASPDALTGLGRAYEAKGMLAEAEATYRKAIERRPGYWGGYNELGGFYHAVGRYPEAEAMFLRIVELTPDNVQGYNSLGGIYHLSGKDDLAERTLLESIAIKPTGDAYSNLGTVQFFRGQYAEAAHSFEQAARLGSDQYDLLYNLAAAYSRAPGGQEKAPAAWRRAVKAAERERAVNPKDALLLAHLADGYVNLGESAKARATLREALALGAKDVNVMFRAGSAYEALGDRAEALAWVERALRSGYSRDEILRAPQLNGLRADPRFQALLSAVAAPS